MIPVPIIWLSRHEGIDAIGPWDTGILQRIFKNELWPTGVQFTSSWGNDTRVPPLFCGGPGVVVLPARHHYDDIAWLNEEIAKLSGVLLILSSDEEGQFPWRDIKHDNIRLWVQSSDDAAYVDCTWAYRFGYGWRYEFPDWAKTHVPRVGRRSNPWAFAGQITNLARKRAAAGLRISQKLARGKLIESKGFSQGLQGLDYAQLLAETWVAPCPAGPYTPDTFRLYEALESGCIPFVDHSMPDGKMAGFWTETYPGGTPFQTVYDWRRAGEDIVRAMHHPQRLSAQCSAWWQQQKRAMVKRLETDLRHIGCAVEPWTKVTAIVTSSPTISNPSTEIIMETLNSIPSGVEVLVALDGVRPEQAHLTEAYDEFLYRICAWCEHDARAAIPIVATSHLHQAGMTRLALGHIDTPAVLYIEHDTPLLTDRYIDWEGCIEVVAANHLDVLRFHHEELILAVHEDLMIDHETKEMLGVPLRRTRQWSQRPSLYNTAYLRHILETHFSLNARCFIEDRMHSPAQTQPGHRLAIYHPDGHGIRRSGHLDGRAGADKYSDSQIF